MTKDKIKTELTAAQNILQEALDTIKATFWIQNKEFMFAEAEIVGWTEDGISHKYDWTPWENAGKAIEIDLGGYSVNTNVNKEGTGKITGVCSIGALMLADVTLYDVEMGNYSSRSEWDLPLYLTGAALAKSILELHPDWRALYPDQGDIIANWNDDPERTRTQIIAAFEHALKDPILAMPEGQVPVQIVLNPAAYDSARTPMVFESEEAANKWLRENPQRISQFLDHFDMDSESPASIEPLKHDALVQA